MKISGKGLTKRILGQSRDGPLETYRKVPDERVHITAKDRGFRTKDHAVGTFEQAKRGLSYFHPNRKIEDNGIHTQPLIL